MTIVNIPSPKPVATNKRGNGKTMKEIVAREERSLARVEADRRIKEAREAAEQMTRVSELRAQQKAVVVEKYIEQETKRAPQIQIDQRATLYLLGSLAIIMFIATAILTADGTVGSAAAARYAFPAFGFLLFGAIEVAILVFLLVYYVQGSRIDYDGNPVKATQWFVAMVAASAIAVAASVYHVLDEYNFDFTSIDLYVGVGLRTVTSLFFVLCSKAVASVLFAKAVRL